MSTTLDRPPATEPAEVPPDAHSGRRWHPWRGRPEDPTWVRPALLGLLGLTAVLYLWNLSISGNANSFYAAAVQAGSESWKAWFFGALDKAGSITVDKPPASLWVMGLSARIFGYSSWSLLVPQALEGVAAVGLLYATVRRAAGPLAGLLAGAALALTPVAVMMFRFDNPDALLVLLVVTAPYCVTRAIESAGTRWLALASVALGFGFLTKSGQALLVLPALSLAYLVAAPTSLWRRVRQLLVGFAALLVSSGWYIAVVALWPASDRPYIGGSTDNSALELAFGYNGLGRLFGGSGNGGGGGGGGNTGFGGSTGILRMFRGEFALEISWLLPAALIAIVALAWVTWSRPRTDLLRAALIVWGGSLLVTLGVFSFMKGTIHPYYSLALAPSIAALVALAAVALFRRGGAVATAFLAAMVVATTAWGTVLLVQNDRGTILVIAVIALTVLDLLGLALRATGVRRFVPAVALLATLAVAVPTASFGLATAGTAHSGSIPTAVSSTGTSGGMQGGPGGQTGHQGGKAPSGTRPSSTSGSTPRGGAGGGMGGQTTSSAALTKALEKTTTTWSAATIGSSSAATLELSSDTSVMAIGGFSGTDNSPTLAQFKAYVAAGKITYFIAGGQGGGGGGNSDVASQITSWVEKNFTSTTIGGTTVYVLTSSSSS